MGIETLGVVLIVMSLVLLRPKKRVAGIGIRLLKL